MTRGRIGFVPVCLILLLTSPTLTSASSEAAFEIEDWEKRLNKRQPPEQIMDAIGIEPGMAIGEIGAGTGRMTMWLAQRVGPDGKVYANDIDEEALGKLERRCRRDNMPNVETIVGESEDPLLPAGTLDLVFMINVWHHADDPVTLVRNARPALKPGGLLAIVECGLDKTDWGEEHGCAARDDMVRNLESAGYEMVRIVESFLNEDYLYVARPSGTAP